jgi:replication factor C subunit 1
MPPDIRNFFGGKVSAPIREKEPKKEDDLKKKRSSEKFDLLRDAHAC